MKNFKAFAISILFVLCLRCSNVEALAADGAKIGADTLGNVVAVWQAHQIGNNFIVQASTFSGGSWSAPVILSSPTNNAMNPKIAVAPTTGNAVAIFIETDLITFQNVVKAAIMPAGGSWSSAVAISNVTEAPLTDVQVAICGDGVGTIVATWTADILGFTVVRSANTTVTSGVWSSPTTISN